MQNQILSEMYYFLRTLVFVSICLGMANCASTSKASQDKSETAKSFDTIDDKGVVYMYRRGRMVGAAVPYQVKINGLDAGGSGPGTFFRWELKPGTYTFASKTGESSAVLELEVEAGKLYFIEQNGRMGLNDVRVKLDIRNEKEGKREVNACKLLVSSYIPT